MKKDNNSVLLDSSFIISNQIVNDSFNDRTIELLAEFRIAGRSCLVVPLIIDEFLYIIARNLREVLPPNHPKEVTKRLTIVTNILLSTRNIVFVSPKYTKTDMLEIPNIMSKYDLRPRDAMIVKNMEKLGITDIVTFDSDFDRVKGINVIK